MLTQQRAVLVVARIVGVTAGVVLHENLIQLVFQSLPAISTRFFRVGGRFRRGVSVQIVVYQCARAQVRTYGHVSLVVVEFGRATAV